MKTFLYFAYGSNLDEGQMRWRCPSARPAERALLPGHALAFGGYSHRWDGAVANVVRARGRDVSGLLYAIPRDEGERLDRFEGVPFAYERVARIVVDEFGRRRRAEIYRQPDESFVRWPPAAAYFHKIAQAYRRLGFDRDRLVQAVGAGPK